jgi:hypothetical protein
MQKPSTSAWSAVMLLLLSCSGCRYIWEGDFEEREQKAQRAALKAHLEERAKDMEFQLALAKIHSEIGRWTIINPTPNAIGNAVLLDTKTGETWARCDLGKEQEPYSPTTGNWGWCGRLQRVTVQTREETEAQLAALKAKYEEWRKNAASAPPAKTVPPDAVDTDSKAALSGKPATR